MSPVLSVHVSSIFLFMSCLSTFFGSTSMITGSRYCEHFHDGQYRLVSFLFAVILLMVSSHL